MNIYFIKHITVHKRQQQFIYDTSGKLLVHFMTY